MATSVYTDFKVYDEQFQGGFIETIMQNVDAFNEASGGALVMRINELLGHYEKEAFWDEVVADQIVRRDISHDSSNTASATKLTQDEFIGVKLNRINGPYETNLDAIRKIGEDPEVFSRVIGQQTARAQPREMLDRVLAAIESKLDATTALENDKSGTGTMLTEYLAQALSKFGDAAGDIELFIMHSKVYWDLVQDQLADAVYRGNGVMVLEGVPATLGKRVLVTDSASLKETDAGGTGTHHYSTLGLTRNAGVLDISEPPVAVLEGPLTGSTNLFFRWQAEYAYNLRLRGCQWNTSAGGVNPTNSAVATNTNWTTVVADNKLLPGVIIKTQ